MTKYTDANNTNCTQNQCYIVTKMIQNKEVAQGGAGSNRPAVRDLSVCYTHFVFIWNLFIIYLILLASAYFIILFFDYTRMWERIEY